MLNQTETYNLKDLVLRRRAEGEKGLNYFVARWGTIMCSNRVVNLYDDEFIGKADELYYFETEAEAVVKLRELQSKHRIYIQD